MAEESPQEKMNRILALPTTPTEFSYWRHNKTGGVYVVLGIGFNVEGLKPQVRYWDTSQKYSFDWTRDLDNWNLPDKGSPRFTQLAEEEVRALTEKIVRALTEEEEVHALPQ